MLGRGAQGSPLSLGTPWARSWARGCPGWDVRPGALPQAFWCRPHHGDKTWLDAETWCPKAETVPPCKAQHLRPWQEPGACSPPSPPVGMQGKSRLGTRRGARTPLVSLNAFVQYLQQTD